ncbi:gluconate transporter [Actinomycetaceae bacterium WB03_NA08]|uniref:Gluconate transporter n=1 Tax=Scrofimicrobium canadense TaxID=2652290 RepID=A0A6N7VTR9_9ACTO|nr:gluconate:H+ symporter [Scrofimicrobium canadense]MSS84350.1 gluconate transporter [Scrofimicrobium canadense]
MTTQLIVAAVAGIATIVLLIVWLKVHPFLSLMAGAAVMALVAGMPYQDMFSSFTAGLGSTVAGVGLLITLGAIIGTLLVSSGGADVIVDTIMAKTPLQRLPWAIALIAFVVGIPLFFEVGVVILIPVVMFAAKKANVPIVLLGIPALAGLSALHGLVPPHPGPLIAIDSLGANLGLTLGFGLLVAIPTVIISGPLLGSVMAKWVPNKVDSALLATASAEKELDRKRPSFASALTVVLLPVFLMLARTVVEMVGAEGSGFGAFIVFVGEPLNALTITTVVAMFLMGFMLSRTRREVSAIVGSSFGPIAGILLIVGAGGGFKQTLVDSGIGDMIATGLAQAALPPLLAGWIVAAVIRVATGSATVATITAAGIMAPLAGGLTDTHTALLVLAIGAGSVFLSHVNDAGFWLVKEYFGMTVVETFKTWSLMETVLSLVALVAVLGLSVVV